MTERDPIAEYDEATKSLESLLDFIKNNLQQYVEQIKTLISNTKHDISDVKDVVANKMSNLIKVLEDITDDFERMDIDDPISIGDLTKFSKERIDEAMSIVSELISILKEPLRMYIADKYSQYLGFNKEEVLHLIENLSIEEVQAIRSGINNLIARIEGDCKIFKENIRKIFESILKTQRYLIVEDLKSVPDYVFDVCKLLQGIESQDDKQKIEFITHLLSRVSNYSALSDLGQNKTRISRLIKDLISDLKRLVELYNIDINGLYDSLYNHISNDTFSKINDIGEKLKYMTDRVERLTKIKEVQKSLGDILEYVKKYDKETTKDSSFYLKETYSKFIKILEKYYDCYTREIPSNTEALAECIYSKDCAQNCPEGLTKIIQELSVIGNNIKEILDSCEMIAQKFCEKETSIISDIDRLNQFYGQSNIGSSDATYLRLYFENVLTANNIVSRLTKCIISETAGQEIDITGLDLELIKALIEVLKARNMRIALKVEVRER